MLWGLVKPTGSYCEQVLELFFTPGPTHQNHLEKLGPEHGARRPYSVGLPESNDASHEVETSGGLAHMDEEIPSEGSFTSRVDPEDPRAGASETLPEMVRVRPGPNHEPRVFSAEETLP